MNLHRTKLSLSHALSQSVKISLVSTRGGDELASRISGPATPIHPLSTGELTYLRCHSTSQFEELISSTIDETKDIPEIISETGKINMPHKGARVRVRRRTVAPTALSPSGS